MGDYASAGPLRPTLVRIVNEDLSGLLPCIHAPTLVVWGEDDPWLSAAGGAELARRIPGARFELLRGAGHLVQEDAPDELIRLLGEHLAAAHLPPM
jgi:pimeloyl-ACP methyl ester carboxylesterase